MFTSFKYLSCGWSVTFFCSTRKADLLVCPFIIRLSAVSGRFSSKLIYKKNPRFLFSLKCLRKTLTLFQDNHMLVMNLKEALENIEGEGKNTGYQLYLLSPQFFKSFPKQQILDSSNYRIFRRNYLFSCKWQKVLQRGRKHCGKRRNCT